jgi:uncharacterized OsmC-like protein
MTSNCAQQIQTAEFDVIDADALAALGQKGKADNTVVRTAKCRTVAEGKKFRHLNYVRNLPPHIVDEPPGLLGDDTAPNPTEALLAALGTCVSVGLQANAVARGWTVKGIEVELEGDINITAVWGTGDLRPKNPGLSSIRMNVKLDVDGATEEEVVEVIQHVRKWSPVLNTLQNTTPISIASK